MPTLAEAERWIIFNQLRIIDLLSGKAADGGYTVEQQALISGYEP